VASLSLWQKSDDPSSKSVVNHASADNAGTARIVCDMTACTRLAEKTDGHREESRSSGFGAAFSTSAIISRRFFGSVILMKALISRRVSKSSRLKVIASDTGKQEGELG
jgi:hypothetical protein